MFINLFMYVKYTDYVPLDTSFASIFASNLAFLMRLTIHLSASSALRLSLVASMLRDKEWTEKIAQQDKEVGSRFTTQPTSICNLATVVTRIPGY